MHITLSSSGVLKSWMEKSAGDENPAPDPDDEVTPDPQPTPDNDVQPDVKPVPDADTVKPDAPKPLTDTQAPDNVTAPILYPAA
ncbi:MULTISPECIES: hypothetical protein [Streptomyces]